jgi:DnaK suppressor protein
MRNKNLAKFKKLLEAKEQELSQGFRTRNQIAIQRTAEMEEEAQLLVEQDLAVQNRNMAAELLRQIWAAVDRIADGSYGICLSCGADIQPRRLEAVPWASYCTQCQESLDLQQNDRAVQRWEFSGAQSPGERAA